MNTIYCAIIASPIDIDFFIPQDDYLKELNGVLDELNKKFDEHIASNFTITVAYEFQGLLKTPSKFIDVIDFVRNRMLTQDFIFGVGTGIMTTSFKKEISIGSDGHAYHNARDMVNFGKKNGFPVLFKAKKPTDKLVRYNLVLIEIVKLSYTLQTRKIIELYKDGYSPEYISMMYPVHPWEVEKLIDSHDYKVMKHAEERIKNYLDCN